jgi:carbon-monoxide dehydrogenase medium subunit
LYAFEYHRPDSLASARALFAQAEDPMYLSGGMTLIPSMKQRLAAPSDLIDLSGLAELQGVELRNGDNKIRVGASTCHNDVANNALVLERLPVLSQVAGAIGDNQVRNRGTLGGSIANSDPAADWPAALVGLQATIHTQDREIVAEDFFRDLFETALATEDIVVAVDFAIPRRATYQKFRHPASGYAVVGVLVAEHDNGIRVGVTGAGPCAFRACALEDALNESFTQEALDAVDVPDVGFNSDVRASAEYRSHLVKVLSKRAVAQLGAQS